MLKLPVVPPRVQYRLWALLFGPLYLWFVIQGFSKATDVSLLVAATGVLLCELAVMVCIGLLSMRYEAAEDSTRLRLSTIFLLVVPIGIYLGAGRILFLGLPPNQQFNRSEWFWLGLIVLALVAVNTIILTWYAEALVWLLKVGARYWDLRFRGGMADERRQELLFAALPMRRGHFVFESGHHGDLWLDLELLCLRPEGVRGLTMELGDRMSKFKIDAVCGPLVEGAYVALLVAEELGAQFVYAERVEHSEKGGLFPVEYRLPKVLAERVRGKRVAIVNDVINAGSAVRGTIESLTACEAKVVAIGCLATLGDAAKELAAKHGVPLVALTAVESNLWTPGECPLCRKGMAIDK